MKTVITILGLFVGMSAFANQNCGVALNLKEKHLPKGFIEALEEKGYQVVPRRDAALHISIVELIPGYDSGSFYAIEKQSGFRKQYVFARPNMGTPDPLRSILRNNVAKATSVASYQAAMKALSEATFNDTPAGPIEMSIPDCASFYGETGIR